MGRATRNGQMSAQMPRIRGNIAEIKSPKCESSSYPPCSCACWKVIQQMNDKVKFLELQMKKYGRIIREFEEMRMRIKWEAEENDAEDVDINPNCSTQESTGPKESDHDFNESNEDNLSDFESNQNGSSMSYMGFEESILLSSTPVPSCPESSTGSSETTSFSDDSVNESTTSSHNDAHDSTTNSFEENLERFLYVFGDSEDEDEQIEQTEPKRKRRKRNNSGEAPRSLPRDSRKCPWCSVVFKRICSLHRHVENCQAQNRKPFNCDECSQTFPCKDSLEYHKRSVHERIHHFYGF